MAYVITGDDCIGCGLCAEACSQDCISEVDGKYAVTKPDECVECGACAEACPFGIPKQD